MQLQYDMEPDQNDRDGTGAISDVQTEQEAVPDTDSAVQTENIEQNPDQVLT